MDEVELMTGETFRKIDIAIPEIFVGGLLGSMTVFVFTSWSMRAVGNAAEKMVEAVRDDFFKISRHSDSENRPEPNSKECIKISTDASLSQMFLPGAIVILVPLIMGTLFGPTCVAGILMGIIISGIQLAISMANSGGAWDNCKKSIKSKNLILFF